MKTKNKSLFKNIGLIMFSTIMLVLSIFSIFINVNARKTVFNVVHADTTATSFYGSSFFVPVNYYAIDMDYTWTTKSWTGLTSFQGMYTWTDGTNYYYSNSSEQYVLDTTTNTWSAMTWNGLSSFTSTNVWNIGSNFYYSSNSVQYVLDTTTNTWSAMTWNGLSSFIGQYVWSDGNNYYYSNSGSQYILNISTNTWSAMIWNGFSTLSGRDIWTDNYNIYYSYADTQYVLDITTNTWSAMTWNGLSNFNGRNLFFINDNVFCAVSSITYCLDYTTNTWNIVSWDYSNSFFISSGIYVWNIGNIYYYSNNNQQWQLDASLITLSGVQDCLDNSVLCSFCFKAISTNETDYRFYFTSAFYSYKSDGSVVYSVSNKLLLNSTIPNLVNEIDGSNFVDYITYSVNSWQPLQTFYIPFNKFNQYNVRISCFISVTLTAYDGIVDNNFTRLNDFNFTSVKFDSGFTDNSIVSNYESIANNVTYNNSNGGRVNLLFYCYNSIDNPVYTYNADDGGILSDYMTFTDGRQANDFYFRFNPRTYYLSVSSGDSYNAGYIAGDTAGYNRGYSAGETAGYGSGYSDGETAGYSSGYNAGETAGYNDGYTTGYNTGDIAGYYRGYNDGGNAANTYTFLGLISAVIDAPIKAFTGLFNFNLLGVNMVSFITALFTLAVIVTIIKKVV